MSVVLLGSTSGSITLQEPAVAGSTVITLPATSGTMASIATVNNNGVVYANSSGQPTTTSTFVFDGTNVGIGTASPSAIGAFYPTIDIRGSSGGGLRLGSTATSGGLVYGNAGGITYQTETSLPHTFYTNNIERMRILSTGNILSLTGGSTTATGTGIAFPATQSASSDANTLDDYEEGTWTTTLTNCGGSASASGASYVKIGKVVTARLTIASGTFTLNSSRFTLPFSSADFSTGVFSISTQTGGFLEAQVSNICYFSTTASGTAYCSITYIAS